MEKVTRDGKTAVLYSPGFGAGWYSWGHEKWMLFDPRLVAAVESVATESEIAALCDSIAEEQGVEKPYTGGAGQLKIEWITTGSQFEIEEYDGAESIHVLGDRDYLIA